MPVKILSTGARPSKALKAKSPDAEINLRLRQSVPQSPRCPGIIAGNMNRPLPPGRLHKSPCMYAGKEQRKNCCADGRRTREVAADLARPALNASSADLKTLRVCVGSRAECLSPPPPPPPLPPCNSRPRILAGTGRHPRTHDSHAPINISVRAARGWDGGWGMGCAPPVHPFGGRPAQSGSRPRAR
jgi:hypothetical protein